jgi:hypothetical protein
VFLLSLGKYQATVDLHLEKYQATVDVHLEEYQATVDLHLEKYQATVDVHLEEYLVYYAHNGTFFSICLSLKFGASIDLRYLIKRQLCYISFQNVLTNVL